MQSLRGSRYAAFIEQDIQRDEQIEIQTLEAHFLYLQSIGYSGWNDAPTDHRTTITKIDQSGDNRIAKQIASPRLSQAGKPV